MGGMTAAALLTKLGLKVLVLEAAHVPGGSSSSFYRKGYVFESGATTLIGFDEHQPLRFLEEELDISLPKKEIQPPMQVHLDGETITRYQDKGEWINEAQQKFGNAGGQLKFWKVALKTANLVWKASGRNPFFPPLNWKDWLHLFTHNNPIDAFYLPLAFLSVERVMEMFGVHSPKFRRFVDEQLMITAQSGASETPFLFGAAALTYTNYTNYYVPGGLLEMVRPLQHYIEKNGGQLRTRSKVLHIYRDEDVSGYLIEVDTRKNDTYTVTASQVVSNIPIWNLAEISSWEMKNYFEAYAHKYRDAWGAVTWGLAVDDVWDENLPHHHQLHVAQPPDWMASRSIFVSMSESGDTERSPQGKRVLNVSTHTKPDFWYNLPSRDAYESKKQAAEHFVLKFLNAHFPGFATTNVDTIFTGTPLTWENWVYRKSGRVGGIPQSMHRSLMDWTPAEPPFDGFYLCGDTVFPGQGIPGVTLSGINVYYRAKRNLKKSLF